MGSSRPISSTDEVTWRKLHLAVFANQLSGGAGCTSRSASRGRAVRLSNSVGHGTFTSSTTDRPVLRSRREEHARGSTNGSGRCRARDAPAARRELRRNPQIGGELARACRARQDEILIVGVAGAGEFERGQPNWPRRAHERPKPQIAVALAVSRGKRDRRPSPKASHHASNHSYVWKTVLVSLAVDSPFHCVASRGMDRAGPIEFDVTSRHRSLQAGRSVGLAPPA